jgi:HSP20 family molecular chaperone IbpA
MKVKNNAFVPGIFNLMDRFMTDDFQTPTHLSRPAVNIIESEKAYTLEIMAAGLKKDDFKIAIEKDFTKRKKPRKKQLVLLLQQEFRPATATATGASSLF